MTFLVPYDDSALSRAALHRAVTYGAALDEPVRAVAIVPEDEFYARERGWTDGADEFAPETVAATLEERVADLAPTAAFEWETTAESTAEALVDAINAVAAARETRAVFVGSDNAGRIVTPLSSVGGGVAADAEYDVHIVRHWAPTDGA